MGRAPVASVPDARTPIDEVPVSDNTTERGPLSGFRIVDLSENMAGPFSTMILGDQGAAGGDGPGLGRLGRPHGPATTDAEDQGQNRQQGRWADVHAGS